MLKNRNILFTVNHLAVTLRTVAQNVLFQSTDSLGVHMKQLNDAKNFKEALSLFDSRKSSNTSDLSINQALKACIHLGNFQHGLAIHKSLTSRSLKCRHIQMSLVQLHSVSFSLLMIDNNSFGFSAHRRCSCCTTCLFIGADQSTNTVLVHGYAQW